MKKDNNIKNIFLAIMAVIFIGALVGGGTYAYWAWQSNEAQRTAVTFTISKPNFTITGDNMSSNTLAPTQSCYYQSASSGYVNHTLAGRATVTAQNNTSASMRATITLKGALKPVSGRTLPTSGSNSAANIHWAIKEVASATTAFSAGNCTGTGGSTYATGTFAGITPNSSTLTYSDIATSITFDVAPGVTDTKYYQVYVWIDSNYTHINYGDVNDDPMQGLTVALTFSETSIFTQELSQTVYTVNLYNENVFGYNEVWIGQPISNNITQYTTSSSAKANFSNRPFYLKHTIGNYSGYCLYEKENGVETGYYYCFTNSQSVCEEAIPDWEYDEYTYECRYTTASNAVTESYVVFEVTPEMASANPGMTAGTYELKGGDNGASYNANKATLLSAFGSTYCTDYSSYVNCDVSGLRADADDGGDVGADDGVSAYCGVTHGGDSSCSE